MMRLPALRISISRLLVVVSILFIFIQFSRIVIQWKSSNQCDEVITARVNKKMGPEFNTLQTQIETLTRKIQVMSSIKDSENDDKNPPTEKTPKIPVLIISYNRGNELKHLIEKIITFMPKKYFSLFTSQDGDNPKIKSVVDSFGEHITQHFQKIPHKVELPSHYESHEKKGYYYLSQHYGFALEKVFAFDEEFDRVIILEEDLDIAPDFFSYFLNLSPILDRDESLFCVDAYNDNGMKGYVENPMNLYRNDFFSGLGWMMKKSVWEEWRQNWPLGYWDEFVRKPKQRKGRSCIRPEISRTFHKCTKDGVSRCQFNKFLTNGQLNEIPIDWRIVDFNAIGNKEKYDRKFFAEVKDAQLVSVPELSKLEYQKKSYRVEYTSKDNFKEIANSLGIMKDLKAGVPRMAYEGVVTIKKKGNTVYVAPKGGNFLYDNVKESRR